MEYRKIGNTDMQAGIIGLGAEHLDNKPYETVEETIFEAMEQGVNMMDCFMPGADVREKIGKAIAGRRSEWLIQGHIGSVDLKQQYEISRDLATCKQYFEDLMRFLGTDYIDFGMLFFIDSEEDYKRVFEGDILPYAQNLKQKGTIRAIGASSHNPHIARKVVESGEVDLLMFSINPAFDMIPASKDVLSELHDEFKNSDTFTIDPVRAGLYTLCAQKNVAITAMKPLGAGKLLSAAHTPFAQPMRIEQCLHYALSRPGVVSALPGCCTAEEMRQAANYLNLSDAQRDYSGVLEGCQGDFAGSCVYCNHCLPCPSEINIATVNKYLDIAELNPANIPPSIRQHYSVLSAHASDCIQCGNCESRCPFSVPIIQRMERSVELFGE